MVAQVGNAPTSSVLQTGANLFQLLSHLKLILNISCFCNPHLRTTHFASASFDRNINTFPATYTFVIIL